MVKNERIRQRTSKYLTSLKLGLHVYLIMNVGTLVSTQCKSQNIGATALPLNVTLIGKNFATFTSQ